MRTRARPDQGDAFRSEDEVEIADAHQLLRTAGAPLSLSGARDRLNQHNLERSPHAIMFGDGNIAVLHQPVRVELEKRFVIILFAPTIVEIPAVLAVTLQETFLLRIAAPKAPHVTVVFELLPRRGIDVTILRQGRDEFVTVGRASVGKSLHTSQFQANAGERHLQLSHTSSTV